MICAGEFDMQTIDRACIAMHDRAAVKAARRQEAHEIGSKMSAGAGHRIKQSVHSYIIYITIS